MDPPQQTAAAVAGAAPTTDAFSPSQMFAPYIPQAPWTPSTAALSGSGFVQENPQFDITVDDPQHVDGQVAILGKLTGYVTYRVTTRTNEHGYPSGAPQVRRRYKEFEWLQSQLMRLYPGIIVPPLPDKEIHIYQGNRELQEERRKWFEMFLRRVVAHPVLRASTDLKLFLTASDADVAVAMRLSKTDRKSSQKELLEKFTSLFGKAEASGDPRVDAATQRVVAWERTTNYLASVAQEAVEKRSNVATELTRLGLATLALGETESSNMRTATQAFSAALTKIGDAELELARKDGTFRDCMRDQGRIAEQCRAMLAQRHVSEEKRLEQSRDMSGLTETALAELRRFDSEKFEVTKGAMQTRLEAQIQRTQQTLQVLRQLFPVINGMQFEPEFYVAKAEKS